MDYFQKNDTLIRYDISLRGLNLMESISTTISMSNVGGLNGSGGTQSSLNSPVAAIVAA